MNPEYKNLISKIFDGYRTCQIRRDRKGDLVLVVNGSLLRDSLQYELAYDFQRERLLLFPSKTEPFGINSYSIDEVSHDESGNTVFRISRSKLPRQLAKTIRHLPKKSVECSISTDNNIVEIYPAMLFLDAKIVGDLMLLLKACGIVFIPVAIAMAVWLSA